MKIGLIKEIKTDENRVALLPSQLTVLSEKGHRVLVESGAGVMAGFTDEAYQEAGGRISSKKNILAESELLLKVKAPQPSEVNDYAAGQCLFTYLHFDENILPEKINALISSGFLGIAYEWVEKDGRYPLLEPMSILSGYLFTQKAIQLCTDHKGLLCGDYEGLYEPASIMIIGIGTIGASALKYATDNHLKITVVDKNPASLNERLNRRFGTGSKDYLREHLIEIIPFENERPEKTKNYLSEIMDQYDIIINCAVRRPDLPKEKLEYLIDRNMVSRMKKGSVICDATACDKDLIETCISSESIHHYDVIDGVIHYNCDHIPSLTATTSSKLLTKSTFPYILEMAEKGIDVAISENEALRKGVSCYKGALTHEYSAIKKNMPWKNILDLL